MNSIWLFLFLGLTGSAGPGHFGFRVLAYRHQLDKKYEFAQGTEDGGLGYSWWLMGFGYTKFKDSGMNLFAGNAGVMGWLTLIGIIGTAVAIALK
ncbi:MAG: hypothetical protein ACREPB_16330 [Arenimonas sp.]